MPAGPYHLKLGPDASLVGRTARCPPSQKAGWRRGWRMAACVSSTRPASTVT